MKVLFFSEVFAKKFDEEYPQKENLELLFIRTRFLSK